MPNPTLSTASTTRQRNFELRVQQVQARFKKLYQVQRIRYDDVITRLGSEFFISQRRVVLLLKLPGKTENKPLDGSKDGQSEKPLTIGLQPASHSKGDTAQKALNLDYRRV